MESVNVKIHPLFVIFSFVMVYFGWWKPFLIYFCVMCLHELAHYLMAKKFGYKTNNVVFMPYGVGIGVKNVFFKPSHEVMTALAGPLFNLIICGLVIVFWWLFPALENASSQIFFQSNLCLGLFNLVPFFPLDGGRILLASIKSKKRKIFYYKAMFILGILLSLMFITLFILSLFKTINLTLIFMSFFVLSSCMCYDEEMYFERGLLNINKTDMPLEIRTYAVSCHTPIHKLIKYIKGYNFVQFYVYNDDKELIEVITETDLFNILKKNKGEAIFTKEIT